MALPGGRNVPTPRESILALSRGSQLPYTNKFVCYYFPYFSPHSYQHMLGSIYKRATPLAPNLATMPSTYVCKTR